MYQSLGCIPSYVFQKYKDISICYSSKIRKSTHLELIYFCVSNTLYNKQNAHTNENRGGYTMKQTFQSYGKFDCIVSNLSLGNKLSKWEFPFHFVQVRGKKFEFKFFNYQQNFFRQGIWLVVGGAPWDGFRSKQNLSDKSSMALLRDILWRSRFYAHPRLSQPRYQMRALQAERALVYDLQTRWLLQAQKKPGRWIVQVRGSCQTHC